MHPLKRICNEKEISIATLAKKSGLNARTLQQVVKRGTPVENLKIGAFLKIAEAFDMSLADLILETHLKIKE